MEGTKQCLFFRRLAVNILVLGLPIFCTWATSWAQAPPGLPATSGPATGPCVSHLGGQQPGCTELSRASVSRSCPAPNCTSWGFLKDSTTSAPPQRDIEPGSPRRGGHGWLECPPPMAVACGFLKVVLGPCRLLASCPHIVLGLQSHAPCIYPGHLGRL